jgi:hypothetical protein
MRKEELKDAQINEDKAKEYIVPSIGLSYNEWHAMLIGGSIGILNAAIVALTPTVFTILSGLIMLDKALAATGKSLTTNILKTYPPTYSYIYTIRSEPWYYLVSLVTPYVISLLLFY